MHPAALAALKRGIVIPAHPLALNAARQLDERRQRALARYYIAAGAGGMAVGVHTTQFVIRDPAIGLYKPVLTIAAEEMSRGDLRRVVTGEAPLVRIAGVVGKTAQAVGEASLSRDLGYHAVLLSLSAFAGASDDELIRHCRSVAEILPIVGFHLQTAAGGRPLGYSFWRRFAEIPGVVAIKIAPFNRYQTIDVVRAVVDAGRDDIALYTGNDDNIVIDLLTPYRFRTNGRTVERRIVGGLLGHWACWTRRAVELLNDCHQAVVAPAGEAAVTGQSLLARNVEVTDCNSAFFDAANGFAGCIAGIHEVLRRQGLLAGVWCLDEREGLGVGQREEIDRVVAAYPHLSDDAFVGAHIGEWMAG
ncbi:dihydrodipicolinate synthase family protein [Humisphaera borealis]|uniref:Dihydrodipicolinate synthase family protein n=1 Tax=Humisphaera borealis TaxID=2807512 RepID=A0A7M2WVF9_9BACT|nr:dihydrodipicolinate synthase family protein [Humisphaera borealis]QOV88470.1 dihydrodipicolinate synthase family protein [Humisphaera borealis]